MNSMEHCHQVVAQNKDADEPSEGGICEESEQDGVANGDVAAEQLDLEKKAMQTVKEAYSTKGRNRRASVVARAMSLEKVNLYHFCTPIQNSTFASCHLFCRS